MCWGGDQIVVQIVLIINLKKLLIIRVQLMCKNVYKCTIGTVTVYICTITLVLAFIILLIFFLSLLSLVALRFSHFSSLFFLLSSPSGSNPCRPRH